LIFFKTFQNPGAEVNELNYVSDDADYGESFRHLIVIILKARGELLATGRIAVTTLRPYRREVRTLFRD
jgi:hypothetical protein